MSTCMLSGCLKVNFRVAFKGQTGIMNADKTVVLIRRLSLLKAPTICTPKCHYSLSILLNTTKLLAWEGNHAGKMVTSLKKVIKLLPVLPSLKHQPYPAFIR